jgi:hypothetical protein
MKTIYFTFITLIIVTISSCSNPYEKEIKEVEDLQVILSGVKSTYKTIELEKVIYAKETYTKNMDQIQTYYKPDSVEKDVVGLINFYKGVKNSAKGFEDDYKMIGEKIEFVDHQLTTLKNDLENNIDLKDSIKIFISNEKKNIEILQKNIGTMIYNYDYVVNVHDSIANKVQSILIQNVE